jgi:hypothetical protein
MKAAFLRLCLAVVQSTVNGNAGTASTRPYFRRWNSLLFFVVASTSSSRVRSASCGLGCVTAYALETNTPMPAAGVQGSQTK